VDLNRGTGPEARVEHLGVVEIRLWSAPPHEDAAGAVTEDVGVRALDGGHHPARHLRRVHLELRMHTGHDDVEPAQELGILVERTVFEDVDLDAGEDPKRRHLGVQRLDHLELAHQAFGVETVRDGEARAVVGEGPVLMAESRGRVGHLCDGAATVGPVRVAVAVASQQAPKLRRASGQCGFGLFLEVHQVRGRLARHGLGDHLCGGVTHAGKVGEMA
jgi:hypothetical protein